MNYSQTWTHAESADGSTIVSEYSTTTDSGASAANARSRSTFAAEVNFSISNSKTWSN